MDPYLLPLLSIVVAVLIAGVIVWAIKSLPGIDPTYQQVAFVLVTAVVIIYTIVVLFRLATGALR